MVFKQILATFEKKSGNKHQFTEIPDDERPPRTSLTKKQQKAVSILRNFSTNDQKQEISFQELSQNVLDDWDISNIKSSSVQQLVELLNLPRVQGVLWAAQEISAGRFAPQLPDVPFEVDEDDGVAVKIVRIDGFCSEILLKFSKFWKNWLVKLTIFSNFHFYKILLVC